MSTTINIGWLNDNNGDKFAPKTLSSQVITSDGSTLEGKIQANLDALESTKADKEHVHDVSDISGLDTMVSDVQTNLDEHIADSDVHFTSTERTKLSGIASGAQVNTITGVKGDAESSYRVGKINITPTNIGLGNVNNTSDINKPVSTAQQAAIDEALSEAKTYADELASGKANSSHTHDNIYYTEVEVDSKLSAVNTSITNITNGTTPVKEATHATSADSATSATDASKLGGQLPSYYAKASDIPTGALADKDVVSESDLDSSLAAKVNAASEGNHSHLNKTVLDGITSEKVSAWDSAEDNAIAHSDANLATSKSYTDEKISALLDGATDTTLDSIKELADAIKENDNAIDALNSIAGGKADAEHGHDISDVSGLQSALDGKAAASHGTHVTFDSTNKPKMDGTAAFGTSTSVARADHVHPTDTSRASQVDLDTLETVVSGKANASHTHAISDVTNLQSSLDAKATTSALNTHVNNADIHFTADERTKLSGIAAGANKTTVDSALSSTSTNPVQNKIINSAIVSLTSTVSTNTSAISSNTSAISELQEEVGSWTEITSSEIQSLFA